MLPLLRPNPNNTSLPSMPFSAGTQAYNRLPSFLFAYQKDASEASNNLVDSPNEVASLKADPREDESAECVLKHKHRNSTSTQVSESTDSSPTTTISTADSSALTDPSPSSSPESPVNILPLSSFSSSNQYARNTLDDITMSENKAIISENYDRPMTSPTFRKPRNAKGLALKLGTQDSLAQMSAPLSPMNFIRPPPMSKPRRKPSNLTLQTSSTQFNSGLPMTFEPPPTPSLRPNNIHHSLSMNSLNMFSPDPRVGGPAGGMRLPTFERSQVSGLSNTFRKPPPILEMTPGGSQEWREEPSTIRTQLASRQGNEIGGDAFDRPADEDAKSPGYPDGPIVIYDPLVYLYLEPTVEEALKFDVVMNVASEVKNPFEAKIDGELKKAAGVSTFDSMDIDKKEEEDIPEPMTAASIQTFRTAFEYLPSDNQTPTAASPTTPKPPQKQPEYIHIPWEHNTDITKDLMSLCETIEDRVTRGKRVLIHCQQGASRSASLIIAYGLYRNPTLTVDAAYKAAQARSKYVSPNISLMYSLQDFRKALQERRARGQGRSPAKHRMALSVDEMDFPSNQKEIPQTAPLPQSAHPSTLEDRMGLGSGDGQLLHARGNSTPNLREMSPGPSSAPSAFPWPAIDKKLEESQMTHKVERPPISQAQSFPASTPIKATFPNFGFSHQRNESTDTSNELFYTPTNNDFSSPMSVDTPPDSQPSSSTAGPGVQGFAAHREHAAKRKPTPFLSFKPMHPLRSAPPPPPQAGGEIKERVVTLPPPGNLPETPALFSPRLLEMAGPAAKNNFGFSVMSSQPSHSSMGFSSMGPPPPPQQPQTALRDNAPSKLELNVPSMHLGIMSPKAGCFEISPFDEVMDHEEQIDAQVARASPDAKPEDILQTLKPKKSFIFDRTQLAEAMAKPLPPLPGQLGQSEESKAVDPRSPPLRGETGIVRSIDDVLEH